MLTKLKTILSKLPERLRFGGLRFARTVLTLLLAAVMFTASRWQWERFHWKQALVDTYKANSTSAPIPFPAAGLQNVSDPLIASELKYKKVSLKGHFDYGHQFIVLNKRDASGPGHNLMAPFILDGENTAVIVSRGFIPFDAREPETWAKWNFPEPAELQAVVQPSVPAGTIGPENPEVTPGGPFVTKWLFEDCAQMARQLPYPVITSVFLQQLGGPPQGEFPKQAISIQVPPSTHFGYTIEWALLALLTLFLGIGLQFINLKPLNQRDRSGSSNGAGTAGKGPNSPPERSRLRA